VSRYQDEINKLEKQVYNRWIEKQYLLYEVEKICKHHKRRTKAQIILALLAIISKYDEEEIDWGKW
jgi:hypothetical protein